MSDGLHARTVAARRRRALGAVLAAAAGATCADGAPAPAAAAVKHLCAANETVVFGCAVARRKIVSVCASPDLSATAGRLQYRFGTDAKAEVAVPDAGTPDWRGRVASRTLMFSGGGGAYLRFDAAPYAYVTYTAIGRGWPEKRGVMVLKNGALLANHACVGRHRSQIGAALFQQAGIAEDAEELELP